MGMIDTYGHRSAVFGGSDHYRSKLETQEMDRGSFFLILPFQILIRDRVHRIKIADLYPDLVLQADQLP